MASGIMVYPKIFYRDFLYRLTNYFPYGSHFTISKLNADLMPLVSNVNEEKGATGFDTER